LLEDSSMKPPTKKTGRKKKCSWLLVLILLFGSHGFAASQQALTVGPEKGWLILHGGGIDTKRDYSHYHRFAELAGGAHASVVVILTPIDLDVLTPEFLTYYKQWWKSELGLTNVSFMDTRNRQEAESETFVAPLREATGVWIMGGHLSNLLKFYLGTRTEREIKAVAERGGVIAGTSAGAMIQGSFLISLTHTPSDLRFSRSGMFLDPERLVGFGLLRDVAVYPHVSARHSEKDLMEVVARYPDLIGIGIDENTAIVLHDDQFEVMGRGRISVFDSNSVTRKKYLTLSRGQRFDLRTHTIIR
jgi:cyanophycinase